MGLTSKPKGLVLVHIHIRSIVGKTEQTEHLLTDSTLGICESWLTHSSPTAAINISGYSVFRRDRGIGRGGGLLVYVKDCLKCKLIECPAEIDIECIGLNITISPEMSFTLICLYQPPSSKNTFYDKLKTSLKCCDFKRETILLGDFNINWDDKSDRKN